MLNRIGCVPDRHDRIADIFIQNAAMAKYDIDHLGEIIVQHIDRVGGAEAFGNPGEIAEIGKQDRHFLRFAAQLAFALPDSL